jgi:hypothetical protein
VLNAAFERLKRRSRVLDQDPDAIRVRVRVRVKAARVSEGQTSFSNMFGVEIRDRNSRALGLRGDRRGRNLCVSLRGFTRSLHLDLKHVMLKTAEEQWILVSDIEVGCISGNNTMPRMKESDLLVFDEGRDREQGVL